MNYLRLVVGLSAVAAATSLFAASPGSLTTAGPAEKLVQEALEAEVAGDAAERTRLLAAAVVADPTNSTARWQSGQVQVNGHWLPLADAESVAAADPRHAEYRQMRDTIDDHRELARWCDDRGLTGEAEFYWKSVLRSNLGDGEARSRLNLLAYRGDLYTREQIAADKERRRQFVKDLERFTTDFRQLLRQAASSEDSVRDAALGKVQNVDDPAAFPALENVATVEALTTRGPLARLPAAKREQTVIAFNLAVVDALQAMIQPASTVDLANYAVLAPWPEVRKSAAEALHERKPEEYVPLLVGAMRAPLESHVDVTAMPDGTVGLMETLTERGFSGDVVRVRDTNFAVEGAMNMDHSCSDPAGVLRDHLRAASNLAAATTANVEAANAEAEQLNGRIAEALATALGKDLGSDVEAWWRDWKQTNELAFMETSHAEEKLYQYQDYVYEYPQAPPPGTFVGALEPVATEAPTVGRGFNLERDRGARPAYRSIECFIAGTAVWTQTGAVPIERISVGDLVLSQNPTTGELAYKPVVQTTAGKPARLTRLKLADETLTATLGHRFWVEGDGWAMAKNLSPSAMLRCIRGSIDVVGQEEVPPEEVEMAYNLAVDDFGSYFVGANRVLVHDVTCPRPTRTLTPGLTPQERRQYPITEKASLTSIVAPAK